MTWRNIYSVLTTICGVALLGTTCPQAAQIDVDGDFRLRYYSDHTSEALDARGTENYMRYLAHIRAKARVNPKVNVYTELTTWTETNPVSPTRNIAGTGRMDYGISQIFAELMEPDFLCFDLVRARVGRQRFPIGEGLTQGESGNQEDKFDGVRFDMSYGRNVLSVFGAISGQNLSESGLYPDPGSDQLYVARVSRPVFNQTVMAYYLYNKLRGDFNDNYIVGGGVSGSFMKSHLEYFVEAANQTYHTLDGVPERGGLGYMGGVGYRWAWWVFKSVKVEAKYAAYEGDDASTSKVEAFSPLYPCFYWGSRSGYVDGGIGGDYPHDGYNPEGSRLAYLRAYVIPKSLPQLRVQLERVWVREYVNNDGYNTMDDEVAAKVYYELSPQTRLQFRCCRNFPNGEDDDLNASGTIGWSEDRVKQTRYMLELQVKF